MKAVVGLAGPIANTPLVQERARGATLIVAADAGAVELRAANLPPHVVIGDFDSLTPQFLADLRATGYEILPHPDPGNLTDGEVALRLALERGATEIILLGAQGGARMDHALGNLLLAARMALHAPIRLIDGWTEATPLHGADQDGGRASIQFRGEPGDYVSLLALSTEITDLTTAGLRWPLTQARLPFGASLSISNELVGTEGSYNIGKGIALAVHTFRQGRLTKPA